MDTARQSSRQTFEVYADYCQCYIGDSASQANTGAPSFWSDAALRDSLAVTPDLLGVFTLDSGRVSVVVDIADTPPGDDLGDWEYVVEASIQLPTGRLVIDGCTAWRPNQSPSISLRPGSYRARICCDNIADGAEDWDDHAEQYQIVLWPAPDAEPIVLRQKS